MDSEFCYVTIDNNVTDRHLLTSCGCQRLPPAPPTPPLPDPEIIGVDATTYYWLIGLFLAIIAAIIAGILYYMHRKKIGFWKPKQIYNEKGTQRSDSGVPLTPQTEDNTNDIEGGSDLKRSPSDLTTGSIVVDAKSTTSAPEEHDAGNLGSPGNDPNQSSGTLGAAQNQSSGSAGNVQSQPDGSSAQSGQDAGTVQTISQNGSSASVRSQLSLDNVDSNRSMTPVENT